MHEQVDKNVAKLRSGYTTGACATATAKAAAMTLLGLDLGRELGRGREHQLQNSVEITLPRGKTATFIISACQPISSARIRADTVKDAGDDPDVTHRATVFCEVELSVNPGVRFYAAEGVGTVTRAGLSLAVGEPAINPTPRKMIAEHLLLIAHERGYDGGFEVHIGVVNGEKLARKTMNARLGIVGGLSILGTTGIVRPFSCSAFIASIHQSIEVAHANGIGEIAASTGSTSEQYIQQKLALTDMALVEMWDFAGAVLKHLRKVPMDKISICGGFGKMTKLAQGHHSLHSKDSSIDFNFLAQLAENLAASSDLQHAIKQANTSLEVLQLCRAEGIPLANEICDRVKRHARKVSRESCAVDVYSIDRTGNLVGQSLI